MADDRDGVKRAQLAEVGLALLLSACGSVPATPNVGIGDQLGFGLPRPAVEYEEDDH